MALSFVVSAGIRGAGSYSAPLKTALVQQGLEMAVCGISSYGLKRAFNNKFRTEGDTYMWGFLLVASRIVTVAASMFIASVVTGHKQGLMKALMTNLVVVSTVYYANKFSAWANNQPEDRTIPKIYW